MADVAGGVAHAVKEVSGGVLKKLAQEIPTIANGGLKKVVERGTEKFLNRAVDLKTPAAANAVAAIKRPRRRKSKSHKRRRLSDVLGKNSW